METIDKVSFTSKTYKNHINFWESHLPDYQYGFAFHQRDMQKLANRELRKEITFVLSEKNSQTLLALTNNSDTALFVCLLSAWGIVLRHYSGQGNLIVDSPLFRTEAGEGQVNTRVPLFLSLGEETGIRELLNTVQETVKSCYLYQNYPLSLLNDSRKEPVFQSNIVMQYPAIHEAMADIKLYDLAITLEKAGQAIHVQLSYQPEAFDPEFIQRMPGHLGQAVASIGALQGPVQAVDLLTDGEKQELFSTFNATKAVYPADQTMHQLFEKQADQTPDQAALVYNGTSLTYRQLNESANRLAHYLRETYQVQPNEVVGLMVNRSERMIIAVLAILKAGGAYLPIDPAYPEDRKAYVLSDANVKVLLTDSDYVFDISFFDGQVFALDIQAGELTTSAENPVLVNQPSDLAYVMYTSGSTGKPKGVMIEHQGNVNMSTDQVQIFGIQPADKVLQFASLSFDASVSEIFMAFYTGATLVLVDKEIIQHTAKMVAYLKEKEVSVVTFPPSYLSTFELSELSFLRVMITAGEAANVSSLTYLSQFVRCFNAYGPTECSVCVSVYEVKPSDADRTSLPIGKPIANLKVYVLNEALQPVPVGIKGEIYVAGVGLARGYVQAAELTQQKFIDNPLVAGEKLYKTGDVGRWLFDGNLEFGGRRDEQLKLRGFRIEPGEIAAVLNQHSGVEESVVMKGASDELLAVLVPHRERAAALHALLNGNSNSSGNEAGPEENTSNSGVWADGEKLIEDLKRWSQEQLPEHMVPAVFTLVTSIPLTPNGKVDKKALLQMTGISNQVRTDYTLPRHATEQLVATVWQSVLGRKTLDIFDNFFALGGDSIKGIQIVSRIFKAGYKASLQDLFQYPTVAQFSEHVQEAILTIDQAPVTGLVPLTPIQADFFRKNLRHPHQYNHAVMLQIRQGITPAAVEAIFTAIQTHHDALRMVFPTRNGRVEQENRDTTLPVAIQTIDLRTEEALAGQTSVARLEALAQDLQTRIDLENGPLMQIAHFQLADGDRVLIVIHHLVIDTVSWRILSEDIESLFQQYQAGETLSLPAKTHSFRTWAEGLAAYAHSEAFAKEIPYWREIAATNVAPLPTDEAGGNSRKDTASLSFALSSATTQQLLTQVNQAFHTEINDILLTALGMACQRTFDREQVLVNLESHGREDILPDLNISRTVGWFTSDYPLIVSSQYAHDLSRQIKEVKESLRRVPHKGIGYGIWKYLSAEAQNGESIDTVQPQIGFNYLGQFDQDITNLSFELANESYGATIAPDEKRFSELEFSGMIVNNQLSMSVVFSSRQFKSETIQQLLQQYEASLTELIEFCVNQEKTERTPSDFTCKDLSIDTLDLLYARYAIQDIYPLSPMQEGMLFQSLYDRDSSSYFDQTSYRVHGRLEATVVENSLQALAIRHDVLRTAFVHDLPGRPVQVVLQDGKVAFTYDDISNLGSDEAIEQYVHDFKEKDRKNGFDFTKGSLLRVAMLRVGEDAHEFIWSHHHGLMDGWCIRILITEFLELYNSQQEQRPHQLLPVKPYSTYIQWLEQQNLDKSGQYWADYLSGYAATAVVPRMKATQADKQTDKNRQYFLNFDKEKTERIQALAGANDATVNNVMQAIWGILLAKYNNRQDVVFGTVVSGRPSQIAGVESMIGLFINAIPVRIQFEGHDTFRSLLKEAQQKAISSEPFHYYPLAEIQAMTPLKQNLVDHLLTFENYPVAEEIEGFIEESKNRGEGVELAISKIEVHDQNHYDFNILFGLAGHLTLKLEYSTAYDPAFIEGIARQFSYIIDQVLENVDVPIQSIAIVPEADKKQLLEEFSTVTTEYPRQHTIGQLFEEQVARTPDATAVVFEGTSLTYREVNEKANALALYLRDKHQIQPDELIGLLADRSDWFIISMVGILKAGGGYAPIDPSYPKERIRLMLEDTRPKILLTQSDYLFSIDYYEGELFALDIQLDALGTVSQNPEPAGNAENLAYVMYTSGSTGLPKGVQVSHRNVVRLVKNTNYIHLHEGLKLIQTGALSFDAATFEIWGMLLNGGELHLLPQTKLMDMPTLKAAMLDRDITTMWFTSSWFNQLVDLDVSLFGKLQHLLVGGEKLSPEHISKVRRVFPALKVINGYGPTENTTFSICYEIDADYTTSIPLGRPIANSSVYILDDQLQLVPMGIEGEICLGGDGLAKGYLNQAALTEEKFIAHPFKPGERLYKTGDRGRWLVDGKVEYLGRKDEQIKIRGFRIEPGEIAHVVKTHPGVQDAHIHVVKNDSGDASLVGILIPKPETAYTVKQLAAFTAQHKPISTLVLPNQLLVAQNNRSETEFLFKEIFEDHTYNKHGVKLKSGDVIFDVGANIGMFSLYVSLHYPGTKVYSFEPVKPTFETLSANASLYPVSIKPFHCGLSTHEQTVRFAHYPYNTVMSGRYASDHAVDKEILVGYFNKQQEDEREKVSTEQINALLDERLQVEYYDCRLRRLSDIIREEGVAQIDLLKVDVEKAELDVLLGIDDEDWAKIRQVSIEIHDIDGQVQKIEALMEKHGFQYYTEQEDMLEETHLYNIYATKNGPARKNESPLPADLVFNTPTNWTTADALIQNLAAHCEANLPAYMVPADFYVVNQFPLTEHGKVDVSKLLSLEGLGARKAELYAAPTDAIEQTLVAIWQEVLGREGIGIHTNFFEIGGHSLKAIQVTSHIAKQLNAKLELGSIFATPTIAQLAEEIRQSTRQTYTAIEPLGDQPYFDLSAAQRRLWLVCQFERENLAYIMPGALRLTGSLNREAFAQAFIAVVNRHESLRTTFVTVDGEPKQKIHTAEALGMQVEYIDLQSLENKEASVAAMVEEAASSAFNLAKGPLVRVRLLQLAPDQHVLLFTMHHIISDGRSLEVLVRDFLTAYDAFNRGEANPLQPLPVHYKDFAAWHNQQVVGEQSQGHREFWLQQLGGTLPVLNLPTDYPRPAVKTTHGKIVRFSLNESVAAGLQHVSQAQGTTLFMSLQASLCALLFRYTRQEDMILGSPISGRDHSDLQQQIGYYLNTLPLRTRFSASDTFETLLQKVKANTLATYQHQVYPFDQIVNDLNLNWDRSRNVLFDVGFNLNQTHVLDVQEENALHQLQMETLAIEFGTAKTDLWFNAHESTEGLWFSVEYNTDLFTETFMEGLVSNYQYLLAEVTQRPAIPLPALVSQVDAHHEQFLKLKQQAAVSSGLDQLLTMGFKS